MKNVPTMGIVFFCLVILTAGICRAVPNRISFQGQLMENGATLTGFRNVTFSIWSSDAGGEPADALWHESQNVEVVNGIYQVYLGENTPFPADLHLNEELFLQLDVLHPSEGMQRLSPLMPFTSTLFAFQAAHADDAGTLEGHSLADLDAAYVVRGETGAVGTGEIADGSVTTADLADRACLNEILDDDGSGSGLNADLLDGKDSNYFANSKHTHDSRYVNTGGDTMTGTLTMADARVGGDLNYTTAKTRYLNIPASAFVSTGGSDEQWRYSYYPYAYLYGTGTAYPYSVSAVAPVQLPQGARVTEFAAFYSDDHPVNGLVIQSTLQRQRLLNTSPDIGMAYVYANVNVDSSSIYKESDEVINYPIINNESYQYQIQVDFENRGGVAGNSIRFYGARIEYTIDRVGN